MHDERGFTLIELLIVVAIIAILAAILIPNFLRARAQSQLSASKGNLKNLATSLESYFVDRGSYPTALTVMTPTYLRAVPNDPCSNLPYVYTPLSTPTVPTDYRMSIDFPAGSPCDGIVDGLNYTPGGGL
ncbi:MAG: prepilin-type N-terminal cleavage/methylation domain-containing protein, partial [Armatimonadetes bacterium]|nr:prepilin-type N-terminal cleavage/methylation domain-containing protein [Armatimonadota bacterium]